MTAIVRNKNNIDTKFHSTLSVLCFILYRYHENDGDGHDDDDNRKRTFPASGPSKT